MFQFKEFYVNDRINNIHQFGQPASDHNPISTSILTKHFKNDDIEGFQSSFNGIVHSNIFMYDLFFTALEHGSSEIAIFLIIQRKMKNALLNPLKVEKNLVDKLLTMMLKHPKNECWKNLFKLADRKKSNTLRDALSRWRDKHTFEILGDEREIQLDFVHAVAVHGHSKLLKYLLNCQGIFDSKTIEGFTPLMSASRFGREKVVRNLCNVVQSLDTRCEFGFTALHFAVCYNNIGTVKILLDRGADVRADTGGYIGKSIVFAAAQKHEDIFEICFQKYNPTEILHLSSNILHAAATGANDIAVRKLLDIKLPKAVIIFTVTHRKAMFQKVDCVDEMGNTALLIASASGSIDVIKLLLDANANTSHLNQDVNTALNLAALHGQAEAVKVLLKCTDSKLILHQNKKGQTALHLALNRKRCDISQELREIAHAILERVTNSYDIDVDSVWEFFMMQDYQGFAVIHYLMEAGLEDLIHYSLVYLETLTLATCDGTTPLHVAATHGPAELFENIIVVAKRDLSRQLMYNRDVRGQCPIHCAARHGHRDIIEVIFKYFEQIPRDSTDSLLMIKDEGGYNSLHIACLECHFDTANLLLLRCPESLNSSENSQRRTPLHTAGVAKNEHIVQLILEIAEQSERMDVNQLVNAEDRDGCTPINLAAGEGHVEIAKLLMRYPACLLIPDKKGWTPLHTAADAGHMWVVRAICMILKETEQNSYNELEPISFCGKEDNEGNTALHLAACIGKDLENSFGKANIVKQLSKFPSLAGIKNRRGLTPLHMAAESGHAEATKILLKCRNLTHILNMNRCNSLICLAASKNRSEVIRIIFEYAREMNATHCDLNSLTEVCDEEGFSPLHLAALHGHTATVEVLLRKNLECLTFVGHKYGETPLHIAVKANHLGVVCAIVECMMAVRPGLNIFTPADVHLKLDSRGYTAMHWAAEKGYNEIFCSLLQYPECLKRTTTESGRTSLHLAALAGNKNIVEAIVGHFESSNCQTSAGMPSPFSFKTFAESLTSTNETALDIAVSEGHADIVRILLSRNPRNITKTLTELLYIAASNGRATTVRAIVESIERHGQNKSREHFSAVSELKSTEDGNTPMHIAVIEGHKDVVEVFLKYTKTFAVQRKSDGWNCLHMAAWHGHPRIIKMLNEAVKKYETKPEEIVDAVDNEHRSALHLSVEKGHTECFEELKCVNKTIQTKLDRTALHCAALSDKKGVLRKYLETFHKNDENKEALDELDGDKCTAMLICAERGDVNGMKLFVEYGADVNVGKYTVMHSLIMQYVARPTLKRA